MRGIVAIGLAGLFALGAQACSGGTGGGDDRGVQPDVAPDSLPEVLDVIIPTDKGQDLGPEDVEPADVPDETVADPGMDIGPDVEPGTPGSPCAEDRQCNSGFCIESPKGHECAAPCLEECPGDAKCTQVQSSPDPVFVCVFPFVRLCQPCYRDTDCQVEFVAGFAGCVTTDAGGFCGLSCAKDGDCPEGYGCKPATSASGISANQCTLLEAECGCSDQAVEKELWTVCHVVNDEGRCQGVRSCLQDGSLSTCDARTPTAESCNSKDDDCNGFTDDIKAVPCVISNQYGSCPGTKACSNGHDTCVGTPPSTESCGNNIDDNCDGRTDEEGAQNCRDFYRDEDQDASGVTGDAKCLCQAAAPYRATVGGDCDDQDDTANPGLPEVCNGKDDNCRDGVDEANATDCERFYRDGDGDQYGLTTDSRCLCQPTPPYSATLDADCNDLDKAVHPNASEVCNGKDDNCDKLTDPEGSPGCTQFFYDGDVDGYGTNKKPGKCLCNPDYATKYTSQTSTDCNDADQQLNPGKLEVCGDGVDNNCNDAVDEAGAQGCLNHWVDLDNDAWGSGDPLCTCSKAAPYIADAGGDCADTDPTRNPGVPEKCGDGIDNDCDSLTDEQGGTGCVDRWYDGDGDGYGMGDPKCLCAPAGWFTAPAGGDCDDLDITLSPGIPEACGDGIDNNCNGFTDEENGAGCSWWYYDSDRDTFGAVGSGRCLCKKAGLYDSPNGLDCNDGQAVISPNATEACGNGVDENCNGLTDEEGALNCEAWYFDGDRDGYGADSKPSRCLCGADGAAKYDTQVGGDCDDTTTAIKPGQKEICEAAGVPPRDDNCNGLLNEEDATGCGNYYYDGDRDGHGTPDKAARCFCTGGNTALKYDSEVDDDCNDLNKTISGGLPELCGDGFDNDCDGFTDEEGGQGCSPFYRDVDGDTYGLTSDSKCLCSVDTIGPYKASEAGDCDDNNAAVHPGAVVCEKDGDCDGSPLDPGEECDDGNSVNWDGCSACKLGEFQLNTIAANDQWYPSATALTGGGFAAAYQTNKNLTGDDIAARLVGADGVPTGAAEIVVNTTTVNNQSAPAIAALSTGGFVVVWESSGQDMSGYGVYGQRFSSTGTKSGGEFLVNGTTSSDQRTPAVGGFDDGRMVVAWQSYLQDGNDWGIYVHRLKTDGLPDGAEAAVNVTTTGAQDLPSIATVGDGRFIVVWRGLVDRGSGVTDRDIFFRLFTAAGAADGGEQVANQVTANDQSYASVARVGTDSYVIVWQSSEQDGSQTGIYARRFGLDGTPLAPEFRVNTFTAGSQGDPSVAGAPNGTFAIAWRSDLQDGDAAGIFSQRYLANGAASKTEFAANKYVAGEQYQPSAAATDAGILLTWASGSQDGYGAGIFARRFDW